MGRLGSALMVLQVPLVLLSFVAVANAAPPDQEVIVLLKPGLVNYPDGVTEAPCDRTVIQSEPFRELLVQLGVSHVRRGSRRVATRSPQGDLVAGGIDRSLLFVLRVPPGQQRAAAAALRKRPEVVLAEPNQRMTQLGVPNDTAFDLQWSMLNKGRFSGKVDADIDATSVWDVVTGSVSDIVAVIDPSAIESAHGDLVGRVVGTTGSGDHATAIAGIIGAKGNNGFGIAGVNWNTLLHSEPFTFNDVVDAADAIAYATNLGIKIHNDAWNFVDYSWLMDYEFAYAYRNNVLSCVAMSEALASWPYPGDYGKGILAVAATGVTDELPTYTLSGDFVDVSAPGGNGGADPQQNIYTTRPPNTYGYSYGTSMAAAHASGVASLIRRYASDSLGITLYNDDLEQIIRNTTEPIPGPINRKGTGRINARRALDVLRTPGTFFQQSATGGTQVAESGLYTKQFIGNPCITADGTYYVRAKEVRKNVSFPVTFPSTPHFWGRGVATLGYDDSNPNFGEGWLSYVDGTLGLSGATLQTYVLGVYNVHGQFIKNCPCDPEDVQFAWSVMRREATPLTPHDTQSYFVPQRGAVASPIEGTAAISNFRMCPNNDNASFTSNARIKVVLKTLSGTPIPNVPSSEVYVLFNGGTAAQGFGGFGADSVIANSQYNQVPLCPDVRYLNADAPTDIDGVTYITFHGSTPGSPGVATRDPSRKWGHYDSELPVYAGGVKLQGRLTSTSVNGSYVLQIKNLDLTGGLGTATNLGAQVRGADFNSVANHVGEQDSAFAENWWRDFDSDGWVDAADFNLISGHMDHDCDTPNAQ